MNYLLAFVVLVASLAAPPAFAAPANASGSTADQLFAAGRFDDAAAAYRTLLGSNANDAASTRRLGVIELYRNHLDAAASLLSKAKALDPSNAATGVALAEIARRRAEAAKRVTIDGGETSVPFVITDPLPAIRVRLNGRRDATFLIDTGAPNIALDPSLARELGLKTTAAGMGTFAGGKRAPVEKTTVTSIALAGATAYGVTADVLPMPQMVPTLHVDGVVGTGLLERFLATLDYPKGRLILRPRTRSASDAFEAAARDAHANSEPCWLVGDHFVFANAQVNDAPRGLFVFDSGLAGGGLMPSTALLDAAHIALDRAHPVAGMGGGGEVRAFPLTASSVRVGDAVQHDVSGLYSAEGSPFALFPFTVQGAISHEFLKHYAYTVDFDAMTVVLLSP